jgi:hypothetical protein
MLARTGGVQRVEILVQPLLRGFTGVDRAAPHRRLRHHALRQRRDDAGLCPSRRGLNNPGAKSVGL